MIALNGPDRKVHTNRFDTRTNEWDLLHDTIKQHETLLHAEKEGTFFSYGFTLDVVPTITHFGSASQHGGHRFIVIQYKDSSDEIKYKFAQSFVDQYSLKEFLSKERAPLSSEQFLQFINGLADLSSAAEWTQKEEDFHKQYFDAFDANTAIGYSLPEGVPVEIKWRKNSVDAVQQNLKAYTIFRKSTFLPAPLII